MRLGANALSAYVERTKARGIPRPACMRRTVRASAIAGDINQGASVKAALPGVAEHCAPTRCRNRKSQPHQRERSLRHHKRRHHHRLDGEKEAGRGRQEVT